MLSVREASQAVEKMVEQARSLGATAADAIYVGDRSSGVQVRMGELEDVHRSEGEEIGLRLFVGQRSASVASSDLSPDALRGLAERALAMAENAPEDPYAGLAPQDLLALPPELVDLDLADQSEPAPADLRARALAAEKAALAVPHVTNSSGAGANASATTIALATSAGFCAGYRATSFGCSASVVASQGREMERDYAYRASRHLSDLEEPESIGHRAGNRAAARLNPVRIASGRMPVLFDPRVASSLLGHLASGISGSSVARKASFLLDQLGERIFAPGVTVTDDPLRKRGLRSHPFDGEGVRVARRHIIADGVLTTWLADSAAARQLGLQPTGHAVRGVGGAPGAGPSNLYLEAGTRTREELLAAFPQALLITEVIGQGVNGVTGDYSRGAAGFLVSGGEIGPAVSGITIASNLKQMFASLEPASDLRLERGVDSPTVLIPEMTVASA